LLRSFRNPVLFPELILGDLVGKIANIVITEATLMALQTISRYRYLSVGQVSTILGQKSKTASEMLLRLERQHLLGSFGNTGIRGYYVTKGGHRLMSQECEDLGIEAEPYKQVSVNSRWSPMMFHRLATLDALAALERDCQSLTDYRLTATLVEYRREKIGRDWRKETTDYVAHPPAPEHKIVPDAGFVLEHAKSGKRALFLIELDRGTERLTTTRPEVAKQTFTYKMRQYDRYLDSGNVTARYAHLGTFTSFRLLTITEGTDRIENMRQALSTLDANNHQYYRFSTLAKVSQNFLHADWVSRDVADKNLYQLIKGN
jgi:hypothetical protein